MDVVFDTSLSGDTTAPVISAINATPANGGTATITWTTDEPANSRLDYGTDTGTLDQSATDAALTTSHSLQISGLTASTTYYYRVTSADAADNTTTSPSPESEAPASFTSGAPDTTPPVISSVNAVPGANGSATITWNTDEAADSRVDYGIVSGAPDLNSSDPAALTSHSISLTGLTPGTTYYYTVTSKDASNNSASSAEAGFIAVAVVCPCSIWDNTGTPVSSPVNDNGQPIEVGTKFQSDTAGYITSLRFYKGAGDTDTHVGHLWSSTGGSPLATVTFSNETASGWQEMALPTPVPINANTTYIVSIFSSPTGNFSITASGLASAVDNPPLHALASGTEGPNGVYSVWRRIPNGRKQC